MFSNKLIGNIRAAGGSMEGYTSHRGAVIQPHGVGYANPNQRRAARKFVIPSRQSERLRSKGLTCNITNDLRYGKGMKAMSGCQPTLERMRHLL